MISMLFIVKISVILSIVENIYIFIYLLGSQNLQYFLEYINDCGLTLVYLLQF